MSEFVRVRMWKQDPSVAGISDRKVLLSAPVGEGPSDARIEVRMPGILPVRPDANGDFLETVNTPAFDAVHTYAVVRQTIDMYEHALAKYGSGKKIAWSWNAAGDMRPLLVYPHGLADQANAYYTRFDHSLKFGHFMPKDGDERVYACRSSDIVAHEAAHAILDGLKPGWMRSKRPAQTGALHEAFGDLTAVFLVLSQFDLIDALMVDTEGDFTSDSFLTRIAEQFGNALGRSNGLRNAENELKLSFVGNDVHAMSRVFTGAVYNSMIGIYDLECAGGAENRIETLYHVAEYMRSLVLRAIIAAPDVNATFFDVMRAMVMIAEADKRPTEHLGIIAYHFLQREIIDNSVNRPLETGSTVAAMVEEGDHASCCYTIRNEVAL